jgi:transcriptional regulator with XRE-family HTH domain
MTYPPYMREKARQLRGEKDLTIDEIAERLAVSRTTVFYWIGDMPRPARAKFRQSSNQKLGNLAMQAKYRRLREEAYELGRWEFPRLCRLETFRDFVCMYIGEGYKRSRNTVSIANSDVAVVRLGQIWIKTFTRNKVSYWVQYHADQNLTELCAYWATQLQVHADQIGLQRKSNSKGLAARTWRSKYGVLTVSVGDTLFRSRLQGWIDRLQEQWLDSPRIGA